MTLERQPERWKALGMDSTKRFERILLATDGSVIPFGDEIGRASCRERVSLTV